MKKKDYKIWHEVKLKINNSESVPALFNEREIWYCHLGENVGYEQDGKGVGYLRPVLIFKKFNKEIFWGLPLTSTLKTLPFYSAISFREGTNSSVILSQIRLVDAKRLNNRIGIISHNDYKKIVSQFKDLLT